MRYDDTKPKTRSATIVNEPCVWVPQVLVYKDPLGPLMDRINAKCMKLKKEGAQHIQVSIEPATKVYTVLSDKRHDRRYREDTTSYIGTIQYEIRVDKNDIY